ncbi:MAG: hypothetical protein HY849_02815 [Nitrosomonadales bacterium]|nr:hypothetical protein [Nitrosomonadales bacterium]
MAEYLPPPILSSNRSSKFARNPMKTKDEIFAFADFGVGMIGESAENIGAERENSPRS